MNRFVLGLLAVAVLGGMAPAEEKADADLEKLQGAWVLHALEIDGKTIPAPDGAGTFIFGKDKKLVLKETGKKDKDGTYKMDAGKDPKELDLIGSKDKENEVMQTIYQLDGDTLKLAYSVEGAKGKRPTAFDSKKAAIMILKRQKS
jgi:uncharacterized protein (TIGR03067 family)